MAAKRYRIEGFRCLARLSLVVNHVTWKLELFIVYFTWIKLAFFLRIMQFSSNCTLYRMRFEVKCAKPHHRIISEALSCATTAKKCTKKHDMMHMQNCCFGNINLLLFCCSRCLHHHPSFLLLWSRNFASMVTWCHACESDSPCNCCGNYKYSSYKTYTLQNRC